MTDYEAATSFLGEWGRFQQQVFFLLCLTFIPNGFIVMSIVFIADTLPHRCLIPAHVNLTAAWRNSSIPLEKDGDSGALVPSKCSRHKLEDILSFSDMGLLPGVDVNLSNVATEGCLDGWEYDHSVYISTIVSEWDLVCDHEWKKPMTSSLFFCGVFTGSFISGQISDRYGRKRVLFIMMAIQTLSMFIQVFSPSWAVFCATYFVAGLGHISNYVSAFVLGTETLGPCVRTIFSTAGVSLFFGMGYMLLPLCAFLIRDWRMLVLGLTLPGFLYVPFWWFIPESPRWLLSQGRVEEAEDIIRDAAKINKIEPPPVIFGSLQTESQSERRRVYNICDLLRSRNIRWISVTLWLVWMMVATGYLFRICSADLVNFLPSLRIHPAGRNVVIIAYIGLSLNTGNLHGNAYLNCFLSALVEMPAYTLSWIAFRWCSRRLSLSSSLFMGGLFLLLIQLIPANWIYLAITLEMMGKFAVTTAFAIAYAYTAELYPTVLRNTALGACSMVSRIGSITAPYLIYLRSYSISLPYILMGSLTLLSGLLSLLLPESFGMPLPDTITHMQRFTGCCQRSSYKLTSTEKKENTAERNSPVP